MWNSMFFLGRVRPRVAGTGSNAPDAALDAVHLSERHRPRSRCALFTRHALDLTIPRFILRNKMDPPAAAAVFLTAPSVMLHRFLMDHGWVWLRVDNKHRLSCLFTGEAQFSSIHLCAVGKLSLNNRRLMWTRGLNSKRTASTFNCSTVAGTSQSPFTFQSRRREPFVSSVQTEQTLTLNSVWRYSHPAA